MKFGAEPVSRPVVALSRLLLRANALLRRARRTARGYATVGLFGSHGRDFEFDPDGTYTYASIYVGDHVNLGTGPVMLATRAQIRIGSHVVFGPSVTIRGGNHRFDVVGRYIDTITDAEKRPEDDLGVVIEDDVWVGGNATILHGVRIGRGSVVGAATVVTKDVPPYSVVVGNPGRVVRARFAPDQIEMHEVALPQSSSSSDATSSGGPGPQP